MVSKMGAGSLVVDLTSGNCFELNATATTVLELSRDNQSLDGVVECILGAFPAADRTAILADAQRTIDFLKAHNILIAD